MSRRAAKSGFTLVEALVAVVLAGGGIAALVSTIGETEHAEARTLRSEKMQRLAVQKLDEIVGTQDFDTQGGDFSDQGMSEYSWTMSDLPTGVENLDQVSVTVTLTDSDDVSQMVETLIYRTPETGTTGANP